MNADTKPPPTDTIAALATAPGTAAIAVIRISGPDALSLAESIAGPGIEARRALLRTFQSTDRASIDRGLVLYFPAPASFTGEDVVELQCHGGAVVTDWLLETLHALGARPAEPGEFSLRAFLNDKLDLTQAEAIADLIGSSSRTAASAALRSLDGEFASAVRELQAGLTTVRVLCEAALDFPDEEIDTGTTAALHERATAITAALDRLAEAAGTGVALTDRLSIAIAGPPNAGKSSLLNRLVRTDAAIVSDIPGTTRDALRSAAVIGDVAAELIDTAGLRETEDSIEREGIGRARAAMAGADLVLWLADARDDSSNALAEAAGSVPPGVPFALLLNKIDLLPGTAVQASAAAAAPLSEPAGAGVASQPAEPVAVLGISALYGTGLDELTTLIGRCAGRSGDSAGAFSARRRHLSALAAARSHVAAADTLFDDAPDLAAEELRAAQDALGRVTGEVTSDELLGEIFATFCIGK